MCSRCDPNARNAKKQTPLFLAAKNGFSKVVHRLMHHEVALDAQDSEGTEFCQTTACLSGCLFSSLSCRCRKFGITHCLHVWSGRGCRESSRVSSDKSDVKEQERSVIVLLSLFHKSAILDVTGLQCNEVIGEATGEGYDKRDRERIVILVLNRIGSKQVPDTHTLRILFTLFCYGSMRGSPGRRIQKRIAESCIISKPSNVPSPKYGIHSPHSESHGHDCSAVCV